MVGLGATFRLMTLGCARRDVEWPRRRSASYLDRRDRSLAKRKDRVYDDVALSADRVDEQRRDGAFHDVSRIWQMKRQSILSG